MAKFLIVDDSKTILKLNTRIITSVYPDAEVLSFDIPQKALEAFKAGSFADYAFLDYNMDEMNGIELAEALIGLGHDSIAGKNICIVSANIQEAVIHRASTLGIEFMSKPFDAQKLKDFLTKRGVL